MNDETAHRLNGQELAEKESADEFARKNFNFLQIEKRQLREMRRLVNLDVNAFNVLTILAERMNRMNAICCSQKTLMKITGLSRTSVHNAVSILKKEHWLEVVKIGTANAYVINSRVFWQNSGDKKMAVFHAAIIASADEQNQEELENWKNVKLKQFPVLADGERVTVVGGTDDLPPPDQHELDV